MTAARIVITGGGTGGHVFPGLALAAALRQSLPGADIRFIGARDRLEAKLVPAAGWPFIGIRARGLRGTGGLKLLSGLFVLPWGLLQSACHLVRFRPRLVVGMGGYVAGPVVAAAWCLRRRIAIHEQNLRPGWTNRLLARLADLVMVSFPQTGAAFPGSRVIVTGNPVREAAVGKAESAPRETSFRILVLGGSQGATGLNRMVLGAAALLDLDGLEIIHQTGAADEADVREAYARLEARAEVKAFIEDVGRHYRWADLVICRAGATTMAELAVNGCAAVLVPFPGAAGGHQDENARYLTEKGAALTVPDRGEAGGEDLARVVARLRDDAAARGALAAAVRSLARPEAAREMAAACLALMEINKTPPPGGQRTPFEVEKT